MIRTLRPGEVIPLGVPRRYSNAAGYIRLRWKIGPGQYVETYEHRVRDGRVTTAAHVHHKNHIRDDNRPDNIEELSAQDHLSHHGLVNRRFSRVQAVALYREGLTPAQIGERLGVNGATVYRGLRREGVELRRGVSANRLELDCEVLSLHYEEGLRADSIAERLGVSSTPVRRLLAKYGITFRPGRPAGGGVA